MITDAVMGVLVYGDACMKQDSEKGKTRVVRELKSLREMPNDGSYEDFDTMVRTVYADYLVAHPRSRIGLWVNEVVTIFVNDLPQKIDASAVRQVVHVDFQSKQLKRD